MNTINIHHIGRRAVITALLAGVLVAAGRSASNDAGAADRIGPARSTSNGSRATWSYVLTATDAAGNDGTATGTLLVTGC